MVVGIAHEGDEFSLEAKPRPDEPVFVAVCSFSVALGRSECGGSR